MVRVGWRDWSAPPHPGHLLAAATFLRGAGLRVVVAVKKDLILAAIARLLRLGWIAMPETQRQPYTVTPTGRKAMAGGA